MLILNLVKKSSQFRKFQLFFQVTVMPMQKNVYARRNLLVLAMPSALMTRSAVCGVRYVKMSKEWVKQYFNHIYSPLASCYWWNYTITFFRLRKGRRQENARASTIGTVSANLLQRMKTTRSNDMIQQYGNLMIHNWNHMYKPNSYMYSLTMV